MLGGLLRPEAAVRPALLGAKTEFGTGSNPVSAGPAATFTPTPVNSYSVALNSSPTPRKVSLIAAIILKMTAVRQ